MHHQTVIEQPVDRFEAVFHLRKQNKNSSVDRVRNPPQIAYGQRIGRGPKCKSPLLFPQEVRQTE